uniref:Uncharacterized protein n=1 Tax=Wolbachia endosymbiont of Aleurodicus dispersus TaxID=1288877 RepID=A0A3B0IUY7_9RICK
MQQRPLASRLDTKLVSIKVLCKNTIFFVMVELKAGFQTGMTLYEHCIPYYNQL